MQTLVTILVFFTFVGAVAFPVMYGIKGKWREDEMGWHVLSYSVAAALALINGVLARIFGRDYPGSKYVSLVVLVCVAFVVWWRFILWLKFDIRDRKEKRNDRTRTPGR